jgi:hypothetical protein
MAKNAVDDWSTTPDDNTDIGGTNIAEGCPAGNLNNGMRKIMAQTKTKFDTVSLKASNLSDLDSPVAARENLKMVTLTQAAYDAITAKDAQTLYFIT